MLFIESYNVISISAMIDYFINSNKANLAGLISLIKTNLYFCLRYYFLLVKIMYYYFIHLQTFSAADYGTLKLKSYLYGFFIHTLRSFSNSNFILLIYDYQILSFFKYLRKRVFVIMIS
jgi:hypothetical protein